MRPRLVIIIVSLLIIADLLTGLLYNLDFSYYRIGILIKSFIILFLFVGCLPLLNNKSLQGIYLTLIILGIFWLVGSGTSFFKNGEFEYSNSVVVLSRYFLFLVLSCAFLNLAYESSFEKKCGKTLEVFFWVNNLFIFLGFFFRIDLFSSYNQLGEIESYSRFGYKGLIYGTNEVAGIYIIGLFYFYRQNFKLGEKKGIFLVTTSIAALLTGTKAALLALLIITIYYFIKYRIRTFVILLIPAVIALIFLVIINWHEIQTQYLSFNVQLFETLDLITFLMSGRDTYIIKNFDYVLSSWSAVNFFVGDAFLYSETDLFDLYFFFGLGSILYLYIYIKVFFIKDRSLDNIFNFVLLSAIAFTAGHIIQSAVVPLFLLLFIFSYRRITQVSKL